MLTRLAYRTATAPFPLGRALSAILGRASHQVAALATALLLIFLPGAAAALDMGKLKGSVYGTGTRNLIVILHGDSGPSKGYDAYARSLAQRYASVTAVALTRPAFTGPTGRSPGQNPKKDHFTSRNNKLLAESLAAMKADLTPRQLIVVGHSGGAGMMGTIVGRFPGIVDVAILAACPCDVPNWRKHRRGKNNWKQSQSPHRYAKKIPANTRVIAITGTDDENTLPRFAQLYVKLANEAGANVALLSPKGVTHGFRSLRPYVDKQVVKLLK
jgi:pimeloyl-ACP methyl ester carboxylesterase